MKIKPTPEPTKGKPIRYDANWEANNEFINSLKKTAEIYGQYDGPVKVSQVTFQEILEKLDCIKNEFESIRQKLVVAEEAFLKISIPDPVHYDGEMAFAYKMIAREALAKIRGEG